MLWKFAPAGWRRELTRSCERKSARCKEKEKLLRELQVVLQLEFLSAPWDFLLGGAMKINHRRGELVFWDVIYSTAVGSEKWEHFLPGDVGKCLVFLSAKAARRKIYKREVDLNTNCCRRIAISNFVSATRPLWHQDWKSCTRRCEMWFLHCLFALATVFIIFSWVLGKCHGITANIRLLLLNCRTNNFALMTHSHSIKD